MPAIDARTAANADVADVNIKTPVQTLESLLQLPEFSFEVPKSVYGTAILIPVLHDSSQSCTEWMRWNGAAYFFLLVNLVVQSCFLYGLWDIEGQVAKKMDASCTPLSDIILGASLCVCITVTLTDVQQTFDMVEVFMRQIPTLDETRLLYWQFSADGRVADVAEGGFSCVRKTGIFLFIILPKLIFALMLMFFGCVYLCYSVDDADVLMNATTLCFIIEIDELLHRFFSSPDTQRLMEAVPPFPVTLETDKSCWGRWRPVSHFAKFFLAASILYLALYTTSRCGYDAPGEWEAHEFENGVPRSASAMPQTTLRPE